MARDDIRSSFALVLLRWCFDVEFIGTVKFFLIALILFRISSVSLTNKYSLLGVEVVERISLQVPENVKI